MINIEIDGKQIEVENGSTVTGCPSAGIYIPHFCYHKKLSIAANCRMCLVQVEKAPQASACLRHACCRRHESVYRSEQAVKAQKGRNGVPADQTIR